jgi:hypothetical protein
MVLTFKESDEKYRYSFVFEKDMKRKDKLIHSVHSNGIIDIKLSPHVKLDNAFEAMFYVEEYNLAGIKEPLIFNPTKWIFDINNNNAFVKSKNNLRLIWEKYKNKNRTAQNQAQLLVVERLYFYTPYGFENGGFSNGPYLTFFVNYFNRDLEKDDIFITGPNWLSIPINLPLNITYRPIAINERFIEFEGWITLNEKILDELLTNPNFRSRAMDYHFSKNFKITSNIQLKVDITTSYLHSANFNLEIDGNDIYEIMKYKIYQDLSNSLIKNNNSCIIEEVKDSKNKKGRWSILD